MSFEITASAGGKYAAEDYAPPGMYVARVKEIEDFHTTEYQSDKPLVKMRVYWEVVDGPFTGKIAEQFYTKTFGTVAKPSNFRSVFTAIVGHEPVDGVTYKIPELIIGKPAQILVKEVGANRRKYVTDVMSLSFGQAAAAPSPVEAALANA